MGPVVRTDNTKVAMADLNRLISKRDRLIARNNARAAKSPSFARRLFRSRKANDLDTRTQIAVAKVHNSVSGMGSIELAAIGGGLVVVMMIVVAASYVYLQVRREEREAAAADPTTYLVSSATSGIWAILGIGAVALGGLIYCDYRQSKPKSRLSYEPELEERFSSLERERSTPRRRRRR